MHSDRLKGLARPLAALVMLAGIGAQGAQAAQTVACLTPAQAQAIAVAALPDALAIARRACVSHLSASSALTRSANRIAEVYKPAAEKVWPRAAQAFLSTIELPIAPNADPAFVRPLLTTLIKSMVEQEIKPTDCSAVDEFYGALEPLPPENVGRLLVAILKMDKASKQPGETGGGPFTICKDATR